MRGYEVAKLCKIMKIRTYEVMKLTSHLLNFSTSYLLTASYHSDDSFEVFFGQLGPGWQTEPAFEEIFAHGSSPYTAVLKNRLKMHRSPNGTEFNIPLL